MGKNRAIFLDRDGVVNMERNEYTYRPEDFHFTPGLANALKILKKQGFIIIVITNQSGIAKGIYTRGDVENLHRWMNAQLAEKGVAIDEIYFCPHHPSTGKCFCRKPDNLLIQKSIGRFGINPSGSFMIGDSKRDVEAAEKTGIKGILVEKNLPLTLHINKITGSYG